MKLFIFILLISLYVVASTPACLADDVRHFRPGLQKVKRPFYAELIFHAEKNGKTRHHSTNVLWYGDSTHYRWEIPDHPGEGLRSYAVRRGNRIFSTLAKTGKPDKAKWAATPVFWMDILSPLIDRDDVRMRDAAFLGSEEMHGVKVEHWRGRPAGANTPSQATLDVWVSVDERFPLVIKWISRTETWHIHWEISKLRLNEAIPGHAFTPQINPKSGLIPFFNMQYKPLWFILLRYILVLLAHAWLIIALMAKVKRARVLQTVCSSLLILGLYCISPGSDQLHNHIDGLPMLLLMAALTVAMFMYVFRKARAPADFALFRGTRWPVIVWAVLAVTIGFLISASKYHHMAVESFGLSAWPPSFLPQTLATVVVYASTWAALEELLFRGYLIGLLEKRCSSARRANVIQSVVFTAFHIPKVMLSSSYQPVGLLVTFIFGLLFGGLRLRYRNLGAPWLVHTAFNTGFLYAVFAGFHAMIGSLIR